MTDCARVIVQTPEDRFERRRVDAAADVIGDDRGNPPLGLVELFGRAAMVVCEHDQRERA